MTINDAKLHFLEIHFDTKCALPTQLKGKHLLSKEVSLKDNALHSGSEDWNTPHWFQPVPK